MVLNRDPDPKAARGHLKTFQAVLYGTAIGALALVVLDAFMFTVTPRRCDDQGWQEYALGWLILVQSLLVIAGLARAANEVKQAKASMRVGLRAPYETPFLGADSFALFVFVLFDMAAGMFLIQGLFEANVYACAKPVFLWYTLVWMVPGYLTVLAAAVSMPVFVAVTVYGLGLSVVQLAREAWHTFKFVYHGVSDDVAL